jgi:hypothetical protein
VIATAFLLGCPHPATANQCASQGNNQYICSGNLGQGFNLERAVDRFVILASARDS